MTLAQGPLGTVDRDDLPHPGASGIVAFVPYSFTFFLPYITHIYVKCHTRWETKIAMENHNV